MAVAAGQELVLWLEIRTLKGASPTFDGYGKIETPILPTNRGSEHPKKIRAREFGGRWVLVGVRVTSSGE